jgi:hypothetical protein
MAAGPGLNNILTPSSARALSARNAAGSPRRAERRFEIARPVRATSLARVAYGPVDEAEGRVMRSNRVNRGVIDNAIYVGGPNGQSGDAG